MHTLPGRLPFRLARRPLGPILAAALLASPLLACQPPAPPPAAAVGPYASADEFLVALEAADKTIRSLQAGIQYAKTYSTLEGGDKQIWRGTLFFDVPGPAVADEPLRRRFAVVFDTLILNADDKDKAIVREESKHIIFDGEWFVEVNKSARIFNKRRVVKPGERIDPLRLGEGPFPLPIGQKRADILRRFRAELLAPEAGLEGEKPELVARFADTVQLRLTPIGDTREARDFAEVRIWYRTSDLLPRLARVRTADGGSSEILLINHRVNEPVDPAVFNTDPPVEPGWNVDIRNDFRTSGEEPAPPPAPPEPPAKSDKP